MHRPAVSLFHPPTGLLIEQKCLSHRLIHPVLSGLRSGIPAKKAVNGGSDFLRTFEAMAFQAIQPLGVKHLCADDAGHFFINIPRHGPVRIIGMAGD